MPIIRGRDSKGYFYRYGRQKKYYYTSESGRKLAKKRAIMQSQAILHRYENPKRGVFKKNRGGLFGIDIRNDYPPDVRKFLADHKNNKIVEISVCRTPIASMVDKFLNLVTLGGFNRAKKELNYDSMFHLYLYMVLDNGEIWRTEKTAVINAKRVGGEEKNKDTNCMHINNIKNVTVESFFGNAVQWFKMNNLNPFYYDAKTNNCQIYITALLRGSRLSNPQIEGFVLQDAEAIFSKLPGFVHKISRVATDIASWGHRLIFGKGERKKSKRRVRKYHY